MTLAIAVKNSNDNFTAASFTIEHFDMSVVCSHLHGKLASSFARNWLAKKYALQWSTRHLEVEKSLAVFTWVKVCAF